jgi:hypothetical protein
MTITTALTAADLLVELDHLGVSATLKGGLISLQPASSVPPDLIAAIRECRADLAALLAEPRRRWREQAEALLATVADPAHRADLQHLFDEREAIASVDGGLDEDRAGQLAYREVIAHVVATGERGVTA